MHRFFTVLILHFLFNASINANEEDSLDDDVFASSLIGTQSLLSTTVDSVSAISGTWLNSDTDMIVIGPEPITLTRNFAPSEERDEKLGYHWKFNRPNSIRIGGKSDGQHRIYQAHYTHISGLKTSHISSVKKNNDGTIPMKLSKTRGLSNCRGGEISAKTNLNNTMVILDPDNEHCAAISGSGNLSYFEYAEKGKPRKNDRKEGMFGSNLYRPVFERKSNGNLIKFIKENIYAFNPSETTCYGWIKFEEISTDKLRVIASDGKTATYKLGCNTYPLEDPHEVNDPNNPTVKEQKKEKKKYFLSEVDYSFRPTIQYEYSHDEPPTKINQYTTPLLLKAKRLPKNRFEEVEYYKKGTNYIEGFKPVKISKEKDFKNHRVKVKRAPVGTDPTSIVTHRFFYHKNRLIDAYGSTDVYDAYMRKTVYNYNKELRPTTVKRFGKSKQIYSIEGYIWDDRIYIKEHILDNIHINNALVNENPNRLESLIGLQFPSQSNDTFDATLQARIDTLIPRNFRSTTKQLPIKKLLFSCLNAFRIKLHGKGNLKGKYLEDAAGNIPQATFFEYDNRGNVLVESLYGNLSGKNVIPIQLNLHQEPKHNGVECYKKHYSYSNDSYNLLVSEEEDNGKGIIYLYHPNSHLIAAKFVTETEKIHVRQFFEYDENTTLIKLIKDNGSAWEADDLSDVTERHITYIYPQQIAPFGLPKRIEEKFWDFDSQQEKLLKCVLCSYSVEGYLIKQDHYDANGEYRYSLHWKHNKHGKVTSETNAIGQVITRKYDKNDNLISEHGPSTDFYTQYSYDFSNRLIKTEEIHENSSFSIHYEYDYVGNRIAMVDRFGQRTRYHYDDFNRLVKTEQPKVVNEEGCLIRPTSEIAYDISNHPVVKIDAIGRETHTKFNSRGSPTEVIHPDGTIEKFEYSLDGKLVEFIDSKGTETHYKRDFLGRPIEEIVYSGSGEKLYSQSVRYKGMRIVSKTDPEGCESFYTYDGAGRIKSETIADSFKTFEYDALNQLERVISWYGYAPHEKTIKIFKYDLLNRLTEERVEDSAGNISQKRTFIYDVLGNLTESIHHTDAGECRTIAVYNSEKQPIKIVNPEGQANYFHYNYQYRNIYGQQVLEVIETDPLGRTTHQVHDTHGRIALIIRKDSFGSLLAKQEIVYDSLGRKVKTVDEVLSEGIHIRDYINVWHYHLNGQIDIFTEAVGTQEQKSTYTTYNSYGEKQKIIKPDSVEINHSYDPLGRLKKIQSNDKTICYEYAYNRRHQILSVYDSTNQTKIERSYYSNGLLKSEKQGNDLTINYVYDRLGRPTDTLLPDGSLIKYVYDHSHLKKVERHKQGQELYQYNYDKHDQSGNIIHSTLIGNAGSIDYQYDRAGRTKMISNQQWSMQIPKAGFDSIGRITEKTIQDVKGITENKYEYDVLDHLLIEKGQFDNGYQSDSIHNRLQKNGQSYEINELNQIIKQNNTEYTYDCNGNLTQKIKDNHNTMYSYDAFGRLIEVIKDDHQTTYHYDALNRRIAKKHNGTTSRFLYQGENEIGLVNDQGEIEEIRLLGVGPTDAEIGAAISLELHGRIYSPIHDQHGNVVCLIDSQTGLSAENYRYSAFGEKVIFDAEGNEIQESKVGNSWQFASKRLDAETGWVYFGRRYYDPEIGRWTTPDPILFDDGPNLYAYLHGSPLRGFDLYGLNTEAYDDSREAVMTAVYMDENAYEIYAENNFRDFWSTTDTIDHYCSLTGAGTLSAAQGMSNGILHPIDTLWKQSGQIITFNSNVWQSGFGGHIEDWSDASTEELVCGVCETTGEIAGVAISVYLVAEEAVVHAYVKCSQFSSRAVTSIGRSVCGLFGRSTPRLALPEAATIISTEAATTAVGHAGVRFAEEKATHFVMDSGKQIWSSTKNKSPIQNALYHWNKHGKEFPGLKNAKQYVEKAWSFLKSSQCDILSKTRSNGEMLRYHEGSNTFVSYTAEGIPKTMFCPKNGIEYWRTQ